ncbi:MAG TPA: GNAT family N-acetyltransferase [Trebonia sp.]|nr:GNAT family N-acetyltransferase [Trebonia sp.]
MRVTFTELAPAEFRSAIDGFVAVYAAAMNPPQRMLAGRDSILDRHAANPGFRSLAALAEGEPGVSASRSPWPPEPSPARAIIDRIRRAHGRAPAVPLRLVGFTYGFHGAPGQWWHDMVAGALAQGAARARRAFELGAPGGLGGAPGGAGAQDGDPGWLDDSFEVAELHVVPARQGVGIGRELLLRLTADRPERTAVLSTADTESRARRLYRGLGFTDLLTGYRFAGAEPPYAVMGARLPLGSVPAPADGGPDAASPRSPSPSNW